MLVIQVNHRTNCISYKSGRVRVIVYIYRRFTSSIFIKSFYAFLGMVTDGQHNYPIIFNEVEYVCILYTY